MCLSLQLLNAQNDSENFNNQEKIEALKTERETIKAEERALLKEEVEAINVRLENGEINQTEAEKLKKDAAEMRALNIENRLAIIDNKIALLERNQADTIDEGETKDNNESSPDIEIIIDDESVAGISIRSKSKYKKYDRRTKSHFVFAIGFNNAIIEGQSLEDSPYKLGGSGFVEMGYAWKTRILNQSNFLRLKYGFSVQWNKLDIKDNMYLVNNNGTIALEEFPFRVDKAKFRTTNLVFPVHLEFGPSKKKEYDNYFRYTTRKQFKVGIGMYGGFNLNTLQKLKYRDESGSKTKDKFKGGYNTSDLIYGISGYMAFGSTAVYVKYDLNPIFQDQTFDQNNISLGLRFDMD